MSVRDRPTLGPFFSSNGAAMSMTLTDQRRSAQTLSSSVRAGISLPEIARDLAQMQPEFAEHWGRAEISVSAGQALYESLDGVWPEALVRAVQAGEEAGQLDPVLRHIVKALAIQNDIATALKGLRFPAAVVAFGVLTFIGLMVTSIPSTARSLRVEDANALVKLSLAMEAITQSYWMPITGGLTFAFYKVVNWFNTEQGKAAALDFGLKVPHLDEPLRNLYFGLWCEYLSLMVRAGITVPKALELTAPILPPSLRPGLEAMRNDLVDLNLSLEAAVDVERLGRLSQRDPRLDWPRYVRQVFIVGDRTGMLDEELSRIGPMLIEEGVVALKAFCKAAEVIATIAGVATAVICFMAVYSPIIGMIEKH